MLWQAFPHYPIQCNLERRLLQSEEWNVVRHMRWMVLVWVSKLDNKIRITILWKINIQKNRTWKGNVKHISKSIMSNLFLYFVLLNLRLSNLYKKNFEVTLDR